MKNPFARRKNNVALGVLTKKDILALLVALAVYATLTLGNITRWSIWFDEAFTAYLLRHDFVGMTHYTALDVHPPLYYWLVKIWSMLFGTTELSLRSFSMVGMMAAMIVAFMFVRREFGRLAAWLGAGFMAISPLLIRYGEEARMYGLVCLSLF